MVAQQEIVDMILEAVCRWQRVSRETIGNGSHQPVYVRSRVACARLLREFTSMTTVEIADIVKRDRSVVSYYLNSYVMPGCDQEVYNAIAARIRGKIGIGESKSDSSKCQRVAELSDLYREPIRQMDQFYETVHRLLLSFGYPVGVARLRNMATEGRKAFSTKS